MSKTTDKKVFAVIGEFKQVEEFRRAFIPDSPIYYRDRSNRQPLGKKYTVTFSTKIPTRSEAQLAYHFVLMEYISEHCGYTVSEAHETLMRAKWGTKICKIGKHTQEVRESIADVAKFPLPKMVEQIAFDLETCADLGIIVPTAESLGYISNDKPYH